MEKGNNLTFLWNFLSQNFGDTKNSHRLKKLMDPSRQQKSISGCYSSSESQNLWYADTYQLEKKGIFFFFILPQILLQHVDLNW